MIVFEQDCPGAIVQFPSKALSRGSVPSATRSWLPTAAVSRFVHVIVSPGAAVTGSGSKPPARVALTALSAADAGSHVSME